MVETMKRRELRRHLLKKYGACADVARAANVSPAHVSLWLRNRAISQRLDGFVRAYVANMLREEESVQPEKRVA